MKISIEIHFLSDWHISSGLGDGHFGDALLIRDADNLPYIPGRALKGALREGARRLTLCKDFKFLSDAEQYFWDSSQDAEESNVAGFLRVSDAKLPQAIYTALSIASSTDSSQTSNLVRDMTLTRQHTALDTQGMVIDHSLHSIECGMAGMRLEAQLDITLEPHIENTWVKQYFRVVCAAVKNIGGNRARGLGQCRIRLINDKDEIILPSKPSQPLRSNQLLVD